jgi:hypothetical protein
VDTSIFAFATDIRDEGVDTVLDNVQHRAGLGGITVAAAYHEGRDVFPHNPAGKIRFLESGAIFFRPDPARWREVRLQPPVSDAADALPELIRAAARRGVQVNAWTVFLHNGALGEAFPDCAPQNAFGDRYVTELCPANPDVRTYARVLAAEVARLGVETIVAESLQLPPARARLRARALLRAVGATRPLSSRALLLPALSGRCITRRHRGRATAREGARRARACLRRR